MHTLVIKILLVGASSLENVHMVNAGQKRDQKMERVKRKKLEEENKYAQFCALNFYGFCFLVHRLQLF